MANYDVSIKWQDEDGDPYTQKIELVAASEAAATAALQTMVEAEDVLSHAKLMSVHLTRILDFTLWTLKGTPDANSDVEIQGWFQFRTNTSPYFFKEITIPAFKKEDYVVSKNVDLADLDVLAFTGAINGSGFSTSHYEDLTNTVKAYEVFNGKP